MAWPAIATTASSDAARICCGRVRIFSGASQTPAQRLSSMQLGFRLPHFGPAAAPDVIRTAAEIAEGDGWHSLWASDRVAVPTYRPGELYFLDDYVPTFETFVTLAFVASATRHIRLGISALV